ncbi:MAG: TspO/MBR family protein [Lapillicoccus sp.]
MTATAGSPGATSTGTPGSVGSADGAAAVTPTTADRVRQVVVTVSEVFCVIGTLVGVGVLGTSVSDTSGGALSAQATLIAPAGPAFSIWSVVYLGLAAYTVWQWLPANAASARSRATGWLAAVSMILNAVWLLVTQQGWIWVSVVVILALAITLGLLVQRLTTLASTSLVERVIVDGTFGLYLGWVAVATCANVTAALVASDVDPGRPVSEILAVVVLAVAAVLGVVFALRLGGRWSVAVAMAWGLAWIGAGRLGATDLDSTTTAVGAIVAAVVVLVAAFRTHRPAPHRAA